MELTSESVLALAPDASSVKAAQALLKPGQWPTLGFNENAVWGECKGSGSKPYQVEADLSGPVFKCTCPSRKFPCKHSLALLLLRVQQEAAFTQGEAPDWVKEWLDAREKRAARQEQKQENKGQPADPAAAAKREASRLKRMAAGVEGTLGDIAVNVYFGVFVALADDTTLPLLQIGRTPRAVEMVECD